MVELILTVSATIIYVAYNIVSLKLFSVPEKLSDTYYLYEKYFGNFKYLFSIMLWCVSLLLIYPWFTFTSNMFSWSSNFIWIPFVAIVSYMFTGIMQIFNEILDLKPIVSHVPVALSIVLTWSWILIIGWPFYWLVLICIALSILFALTTKTLSSCILYWLETSAFVSVLSILISLSLIKLLSTTNY